MYKVKLLMVFYVLLSLVFLGQYSFVFSAPIKNTDEKIKKVDGYRELSWDDLMPDDWEPPAEPEPENPFKKSKFLNKLDSSNDENSFSSSRNIAPVVASLDKQKIRIAGFITPVKYEGKKVSEFLLVPYAGACIHVPPPPENQIIYVKLPKSILFSDSALWEPVWVNGTIRTESASTQYAPTGYTMQSDKVTPYE